MQKHGLIKRSFIWILFCEAVGGLATLLTRKGLEAFDTLQKPALTPPHIVFPIAWSVLLALMGIGFALVRDADAEKHLQDRAELAFSVQLTFFFCWMIWFFGLGWFGFAALWLCGMLAAILAMIAAYRKISKTAAWLQLLYLLWSCFALYLNIGVWMLNR